MKMTRVTLAMFYAITFLACNSGTSGDNSKSAKKVTTEPGRPDPASDQSTVRVTGIPDENPTKIAREFQPVIQLLSTALGQKVDYVPVTDYGAAVQALVAGKVDFAWLGGFTHVQARTMTKVIPVVMRDIDREFRSVIIAHSASGITEPKDIKGKKFAFGSKSSTSGHLMPRHFLRTEYGIDPTRDLQGSPIFSGAHDATIKMVESGKVQAGAVNKQVWDRLLSERKVDPETVRVIWTTPPYVDYVWTARAEVSSELRERFKQAFLSLDSANPAHAEVLQRMGAKSYVAADAKDFDAIEQVARSSGLLK